MAYVKPLRLNASNTPQQPSPGALGVLVFSIEKSTEGVGVEDLGVLTSALLGHEAV